MNKYLFYGIFSINIPYLIPYYSILFTVMTILSVEYHCVPSVVINTFNMVFNIKTTAQQGFYADCAPIVERFDTFFNSEHLLPHKRPAKVKQEFYT